MVCVREYMCMRVSVNSAVCKRLDGMATEYRTILAVLIRSTTTCSRTSWLPGKVTPTAWLLTSTSRLKSDTGTVPNRAQQHWPQPLCSAVVC